MDEIIIIPEHIKAKPGMQLKSGSGVGIDYVLKVIISRYTSMIDSHCHFTNRCNVTKPMDVVRQSFLRN